MFSVPHLLQKRREMLVKNVMKYTEGLLQKCGVHSAVHPLIATNIRLLVETFNIKEAIPGLSAKGWCFMAIVFLKLVSYRVEDLRRTMFDRAGVIQKVLGTIGYERERLTSFEAIVVYDL